MSAITAGDRFPVTQQPGTNVNQVLVLRSEWIKLWSLRSTRWSLALGLLGMLLGIVVAAFDMGRWSQMSLETRLHYKSVDTALIGWHLSELAIGVLGVLVITEVPAAYVPAAAERELYINLLLVSRRHSGQGIGAALIEHAKQEAAARGIGLIRVDCWAGQDGSLVRVYEKYGFSRVQDFTVALPAGEWPGMLLAMRLARQRPGCG